MKVLHVISSTDPRGGGPIEAINAMSEVWIRHGHTSHVACLDKPDAPWLDGASTTVFPLGLATSLLDRLPGRGYGYSPLLAPWLRKHARDYDAVILHGLWNYGSYGGWRGLHGSPTPYFVFTHGMLDPWFITAYPLKARLKGIFWKLFEARVLRDAAGVLFTTDEERDLAARSFQPYRAKGLVVGLGARDVVGDPARGRAAFLAKVPGVAGRRYVLFLSRIHPKKGVDLLIEAFAEQAADDPGLDLVIAGPDQVGLQRDLVRRAETLGVAGRIHWPGMLTGDAKAGAFAGAAFFALPSHQENFGIVVAEALAYGTPVLITNKVSIWPPIEEDDAGLVVNDDVRGVGDGLSRFAALGPDDRAAMARNARACFLRRFELEGVALGLLATLARQVPTQPQPGGQDAVSAPAHQGRA